MALFPLKLPPGFSRPGTKYDAKGRWYTGTLVRWFEGVMQAVGGWQVSNRSAAADVAAAISDDGGAFTDQTADANDAGTSDVIIIPATPQVDDAFYTGFNLRFTEVDFVISTLATDGSVTWEYWNGSAWTALSGVVDGTTNFTVSPGTVAFTLPSDWAQNTVNSQGPFYYARARVTSAGTSVATGDTVDIGTGPIDVDEPPRGAHAWRTNSATSRLAFGTATKLWIFGDGSLDDRTPAGFTTGGEDAVSASGAYGSGAYGVGPYGTGDAALSALIEANTWQLDNYGEDLVMCAFSDGKIYRHDTSAGGVAAVVSNAPTDCKGVVVTPENFLVALAASGDRRGVEWADIDDITDWAAAPDNQAGDHILPGSGEILGGRRGKDETLIWTTDDLFAMRYIGGQFIYTFPKVGSKCGAISRHAMQVVDGEAFWMGNRGFYVYNGYVDDLPSTVGDYVFNDMNTTQSSKIWCDSRSAYGEVTWYYPSGGSDENDRYVTYNRNMGIWYFGDLERTAGVDRGAFSTSLAMDAGGLVYQHEVGTGYLDVDGTTTLTPTAESGPVEIGNGDNVMILQDMIPDENTLGDVQVSIFTALFPTDTEVENGPFAAAQPTNLRLLARQIRLKIEQVTAGWRFGVPRLDVEQGGQR